MGKDNILIEILFEDICGNGEFLHTLACAERAVADSLDCFRNCELRKRCAALKCILADGGDNGAEL